MRSQLRLGIGHQIAGLGREADQHLPGGLAGAEPGEDVGRRLEHDLGNPASFLILPLGQLTGRKSATAAAITTTSAVGASSLDRRLHLCGGLDGSQR